MIHDQIRKTVDLGATGTPSTCDALKVLQIADVSVASLVTRPTVCYTCRVVASSRGAVSWIAHLLERSSLGLGFRLHREPYETRSSDPGI
jgi:hypothetical protein